MEDPKAGGKLLFPPITLNGSVRNLRERYRSEVKRLKTALEPLYAVRAELIGSAALDGVPTERVFDLLLEMPRTGDAAAYRQALTAAGYTFVREADGCAEFALGCSPSGYEQKAVRLRLRTAGDPGELYLRDRLAAHPEIAEELARLKKELLAACGNDRAAYEAGKAPFFEKQTALAREEFSGRYRCAGCGGCRYPGMPYAEQLREKEARVRGLLGDVPVEPCPVRTRYRNKMEYTFGNEAKGAPMILGLHPKGSYLSVTDASDCLLVPEDFNRIVRSVSRFSTDRGYTFYHKKTHEGLLRALVLRRGVRTNELLINIVTASDGEMRFDEAGFVSMLLALPTDARIAGILRTVNDLPADTVSAEAVRVLYGRAYCMEEMMGLRFRAGAFSFFQTNVDAAERLYRDALGMIPDLAGKTVFDLFCGTGTITQAAARTAKKAVGIEISEDAVRSARENALLNGIRNCEFLPGDVGEVLDRVSDKPDVIIVDPPRSGIREETMRKILAYGVKEILYISCNPATLAENLRTAEKAGYRAAGMRAYDNFPQTEHVETVCLLSRSK